MIAIRYALFALLATLVNIAGQWLLLCCYTGSGALYAAMAIGTLAGLLTKYILDKRWIFYHTPRNRKDDARKFLLYSCMGIFTTLIFWGMELMFHHLIPGPGSKYAGALIGLGIGYLVKYFLDKRFVFIHKSEATA